MYPLCTNASFLKNGISRSYFFFPELFFEVWSKDKRNLWLYIIVLYGRALIESQRLQNVVKLKLLFFFINTNSSVHFVFLFYNSSGYFTRLITFLNKPFCFEIIIDTHSVERNNTNCFLLMLVEHCG